MSSKKLEPARRSDFSGETPFPFQRRAEHVEAEATRRAGPCLFSYHRVHVPTPRCDYFTHTTWEQKLHGVALTCRRSIKHFLRHPESNVTNTVGKSLNNAHFNFSFSSQKVKKEVNTTRKKKIPKKKGEKRSSMKGVYVSHGRPAPGRPARGHPDSQRLTQKRLVAPLSPLLPYTWAVQPSDVSL